MPVNTKLHLKEAKTLYAKNSRYFAYYADLLFENGKIRKAEKILEKNLPSYKEYLTGYLTYAKVLMEKDKLEKASEVLKDALEIDSRCVSTYKLLGDLEIMKTNSHNHLQYYSEVMRYDPCNSTIKNMLHILEKEFDLKSEDDILSRYYSDKDISLPKIPNSERDILFSEEEEKNIKKLNKMIERSDKEKTDSIFEDIESEIKNSDDEIETDDDDDNDTLTKISVFSSMEDVHNKKDLEVVNNNTLVEVEIEPEQEIKGKEEDNNSKKRNISIRKEENVKIETVSKVVDYFKDSFEKDDTDNDDHKIKGKEIDEDKKGSYNDFFESSIIDGGDTNNDENDIITTGNNLENQSPILLKNKNKFTKKKDDSFINNFFDSQVDSNKQDYNLPSADMTNKNSSDIIVSSKQGSESRVDFNELKETIQKEQEQQNNTQVSEELREETLQEFYDNRISFNHLPIESEFSSVMNNMKLPELEIEIDKEKKKKKEERRFIQHKDMELEDIDLIEEARNQDEENNETSVTENKIVGSHKDIEINKKIDLLDKKPVTKPIEIDKFITVTEEDDKNSNSDDFEQTEKRESIKEKETELSFNENKILRSYDEIDLLEEERVYRQAGNLSLSEDGDDIDYDNFDEENNNSTGILIDDDVNFKKVVVDKVIGDTESPKSINKISIVTPTLGEIYSAQGEFQKSKEVYQKLVQKEPENLDHKINLITAEFNLTKAKITVELDYYRNLLETYPDNEKYKSRFKNFETELEKVKIDTNKKIDELKE